MPKKIPKNLAPLLEQFSDLPKDGRDRIEKVIAKELGDFQFSLQPPVKGRTRRLGPPEDGDTVVCPRCEMRFNP